MRIFPAAGSQRPARRSSLPAFIPRKRRFQDPVDRIAEIRQHLRHIFSAEDRLGMSRQKRLRIVRTAAHPGCGSTPRYCGTDCHGSRRDLGSSRSNCRRSRAPASPAARQRSCRPSRLAKRRISIFTPSITCSTTSSSYTGRGAIIARFSPRMIPSRGPSALRDRFLVRQPIAKLTRPRAASGSP